MSYTKAAYYTGPPEAAVAAFHQDLERRNGQPASMTWTGLHLVVLWEDDRLNSRQLASARFAAAVVAAALLALAGYLFIIITNDLGEADHFYNALGTAAFGLAALSVALGLRR